jgi:hypothetical protein
MADSFSPQGAPKIQLLEKSTAFDNPQMADSAFSKLPLTGRRRGW